MLRLQLHLHADAGGGPLLHSGISCSHHTKSLGKGARGSTFPRPRSPGPGTITNRDSSVMRVKRESRRDKDAKASRYCPADGCDRDVDAWDRKFPCGKAKAKGRGARWGYPEPGAAVGESDNLSIAVVVVWPVCALFHVPVGCFHPDTATLPGQGRD